ncbi:DUF1275 domain-containing protein [Burkholderia sp. Ac-20345]|uniref:DUF1275 family protein n=1 Tax=Burkholderia lata (strain ATCC 17760 / DSM 23089 / LMG 22485 / NCIMB 9086 / R18194 / 383) TaxID=482957 RepID=UPI0014538681|nr:MULTISPECIES: DUF1275 family protein [Burkholderia]MBN3779627.1 DUF1275 domain-containing protein [Burkholderia sp. Ac-20345]VWB44127.1 hypothetical protein BLA15816_02007 [Burkholderia lata]
MMPDDNLLATIAGYADTLGFFALSGLFTAHVTGHLVLIGAEVAGFGQGLFVKLTALPAFVVGIFDEAIAHYGLPGIVCVGRGSPFRANAFTEAVLAWIRCIANCLSKLAVTDSTWFGLRTSVMAL